MDDGPEGSAAPRRERRLGPARKAALAAMIGHDLLVVVLGLRRRRLPDLVRRLQRVPRLRLAPLEPRRLGRIVDRVLRLGGRRPRCLVSSLVFLRMLRRQGTPAELVIGLPARPTTPEAHAWVEVDREVVGPPPGRLGRRAMARYGSGPPG